MGLALTLGTRPGQLYMSSAKISIASLSSDSPSLEEAEGGWKVWVVTRASLLVASKKLLLSSPSDCLVVFSSIVASLSIPPGFGAGDLGP